MSRSRGVRAWRPLSAGLLDAGLASLATFAVGVYAARSLNPVDLGVFALHFAAFTLVCTSSHQGIFIPMEAAASASKSGLRLLRSSLGLAWIPVLVSPVVMLLPLAAAPGAPRTLMGLTAIAASCLSPVQDHLRRMLHLGERSGRAAFMSALQLGVVLTGLILLPSKLPLVAVPFAALALANLSSLALGVVLVHGSLHLGNPKDPGERPETPTLRELLTSGKWLFGAQLSSAAATFVAAALLGRLVSIEALGMADAARIVGRPVLVMTTGMSAVLGPRLMRAGASAADADGRAIGRTYKKAVVVCVLAYLVLFGWPHALNPLAVLVPVAFTVPLLVAFTVIANGLVGGVLPPRFEVIGAGQARGLLKVDVVAGIVQVLVALTSPLLLALALPTSHGFFALARHHGLVRLRRKIYRSRRDGGGSLPISLHPATPEQLRAT